LWLFNCFLSILISEFFLSFFQLHFLKAANISHQAQRLGANIFQRSQTFLIRHKGWARTFFKRPQTISSSAKVGLEHFSKAANIFHQAQRLGANIFQRPRTFFIRRKGLAQTSFKVCPFFISKQVISRSAQSFIFSKPDRTFLQVCFNFQSKSMQERSKVLKVKAKQKSSMCSPRALEMPLYKECKKLIISSSSPYHHLFMLSIPPSLPAKFPHSPLFHGWT
jgi:hypothetical protein